MTERIVWTEEYAVGVEEIDAQHQQFIAIANDLLDLTDQPFLDVEAVHIALDRLGNYALYHLGTEEQYFIKCAYAEAADHVAAHDRYREMMRKFAARLADEKTDYAALLGEAASFSGSWLLGHIISMDKKYAETFHKCGLK